MFASKLEIDDFLSQVSSINDRSNYRAVEHAFKAIGCDAYSDTLFRTLAAILHLVSEKISSQP